MCRDLRCGVAELVFERLRGMPVSVSDSLCDRLFVFAELHLDDAFGVGSSLFVAVSGRLGVIVVTWIGRFPDRFENPGKSADGMPMVL